MGTFIFLNVCGDGQMTAKQAWYYAKFFGKCYSFLFFATFQTLQVPRYLRDDVSYSQPSVAQVQKTKTVRFRSYSAKWQPIGPLHPQCFYFFEFRPLSVDMPPKMFYGQPKIAFFTAFVQLLTTNYSFLPETYVIQQSMRTAMGFQIACNSTLDNPSSWREKALNTIRVKVYDQNFLHYQVKKYLVVRGLEQSFECRTAYQGTIGL